MQYQIVHNIWILNIRQQLYVFGEIPFSQRIWVEATNSYFFLVPRLRWPLQTRKIIRILSVYIVNAPEAAILKAWLSPNMAAASYYSNIWSRGCKQRISSTRQTDTLNYLAIHLAQTFSFHFLMINPGLKTDSNERMQK